ncbi:S1C family serine protease [Lysinibacillus sp. BW-2-10]|uniref:S1C family serine protease n=1 Tax=Lysinibacillus sp. BW-2-10 TaxID=2590030 RepID=UPI00117F21D8|nr:trypsin-like peptidase domain-containing protein [Lysinibacillus sp. BW-2-10]TSI05978.1 trypsin-like peptidase domain-containing protein [Lysinibacillus sp. BW-2-10]
MAKDKENEVEPISEEELIELVLEAQKEALEKARLERLSGIKKQKKRPRSVRLVAWIMAGMLLFSTFAAIFEIYSIPAIEFIKKSAALSQQDEIKTYKKAIVEVKTNIGKGTGFSISDDGYIVTNEHVIDDALTITVTFPDDGIYKGEVVESYPTIDLAILKVDSENLPHLSLEKSYEPTKGEQIYFIGNPLYFTGIANEGKVIDYTLLQDWEDEVIMLDAPVYHGNSGSPVINKVGNVIGIVFATTKTEEYGRVGLFIPIDLLHEKLNLLK